MRIFGSRTVRSTKDDRRVRSVDATSAFGGHLASVRAKQRKHRSR
jgi:hypothetical protein